MRLGELRVERVGENWKFDVQAWLGDMDFESLRVQLYADSTDEHAGLVSNMLKTNAIVGAVNGYSFTGLVPADRPANHYTPRVVPYHPQAFIPHEDQHIFWAS
jgi:starch phosphorylase